MGQGRVLPLFNKTHVLAGIIFIKRGIAMESIENKVKIRCGVCGHPIVFYQVNSSDSVPVLEIREGCTECCKVCTAK